MRSSLVRTYVNYTDKKNMVQRGAKVGLQLVIHCTLRSFHKFQESLVNKLTCLLRFPLLDVASYSHTAHSNVVDSGDALRRIEIDALRAYTG